MLTRREAILVKLESTYRTDSSPAITDAVWAEEINFEIMPDMNERPGVKDTLGPKKQVNGGELCKITFKVELKGSGSAGTAPEFGVLLQACKHQETIVASTSVTYSPDSSTDASVTIEYYQDGKLKKALGCVGEVTMDSSARKISYLNFTMYGHPEPEIDAAMINPTYNEIAPPTFSGVSFSADSYAVQISSFNVDAGITVAQPDSVSASNGYGQLRVSDRAPTVTFDPEAVLVATKNFYAMLRAGTEFAIDTGVVGSAGNAWRFQADAAALTGISEGDRDGIRTNELTAGLYETTGDDQYSLAFT